MGARESSHADHHHHEAEPMVLRSISERGGSRERLQRAAKDRPTSMSANTMMNSQTWLMPGHDHPRSCVAAPPGVPNGARERQPDQAEHDQTDR
jgi:hypothetical protein